MGTHPIFESDFDSNRNEIGSYSNCSCFGSGLRRGDYRIPNCNANCRYAANSKSRIRLHDTRKTTIAPANNESSYPTSYGISTYWLTPFWASRKARGRMFRSRYDAMAGSYETMADATKRMGISFQYVEGGNMDYDHHNDYPVPGYDDHNDGGIWETIAPFFEYLNSNEFCDMFQLLPEEWDPKHWTGICRANNKLNKELTMLIESLFTGIQREKWSEEMCQSIGYYLKDVFKLSYWPEGLGYVDALYEPCKCTHNIVYDLSMGASPNLPGVMVCGKTWMDSFNYMEMEIPENFTISASAEQLLGFWLDSQEDVMKFKKSPLASLQMWADKWMSSAYKLYEGLKNADMLLAQVKARMAAFGLDNSDFNNLNNTDLINGIYQQNMAIWGNVSESVTEKRLYNFWEDPEGKMPSDEELEAMLGFALEFGFDAQKMMQLAMKPYESSPGPDGTMVNNLVWVYRLYTERMNEIVTNDSAKTFIPVDVFQMLMYHQEELFSEWQYHLASDSALSEENHSFSDHIFATWIQVIADKVKEAEMKPTMSYDK